MPSPSSYQTYLNKLASFVGMANGNTISLRGPYWYMNTYSGAITLTKDYSAILRNGSFDNVKTVGSDKTLDCVMLDHGTLIITYDENTGDTALSFQGFTKPNPRPFNYNGGNYTGFYSFGTRSNYTEWDVYLYGDYGFDSSWFIRSWSHSTYNDTLGKCLEYCASHFRHVSVIVNNEYWVDLYPHWESVPTLSGNGKTIGLSRIASNAINYGESVTGASSSAFQILSNASLVKNIIDEILYEPDKVTVKYTIPSATYSYIKLVYKKGSIPANYSDGTAIDITQASTEQQISGLADGETWWFVIFTDKTTSEPKSLRTTDLQEEKQLSEIVKVNSMTNAQGYVTSDITETSINNLSSYFGTERVLRIEHSSWAASYIRSFDGSLASSDATNTLVFTYSYIPINRSKVVSIKFKARIPTNYSAQNALIEVKTAYYSGNTMTPNSGSVNWDNSSGSSWKEYELTYANPVDVDYIQIKTGYNDWYIKDVVITVQ